MRSVDFNPITLTTGDCTDTGVLIDYQTSTPAALHLGHLKLSMDPYNNKLRFTGLTSGVSTSPGTHTITVTGTLPDERTSESFTFDMTATDCIH